MKFFFPGATTPAEGETAYTKVFDFADAILGWDATRRRIFRITYTRGGKTLTFEVGQPAHMNTQTVLAIVKSDAYLVFTQTRGFELGMPVFIAKNALVSVDDFE